jgi:hypothetical protein
MQCEMRMWDLEFFVCANNAAKRQIFVLTGRVEGISFSLTFLAMLVVLLFAVLKEVSSLTMIMAVHNKMRSWSPQRSSPILGRGTDGAVHESAKRCQPGSHFAFV